MLNSIYYQYFILIFKNDLIADSCIYMSSFKSSSSSILTLSLLTTNFIFYHHSVFNLIFYTFLIHPIFAFYFKSIKIFYLYRLLIILFSRFQISMSLFILFYFLLYLLIRLNNIILLIIALFLLLSPLFTQNLLFYHQKLVSIYKILYIVFIFSF